MSQVNQYTCLKCGARFPDHTEICMECGSDRIVFEEPPEAWLGRVVDDKYEVVSVLGTGGMGMVFEARRTLIGDLIALKVLFPRLLESPLQRRLFRDEAVAAARLSHSNVVTVFDTELSPETGTAYIAMELLRGRTLKELLREEAPMDPEKLLPIALEICAGLSEAHHAQIIHRDLKPDNIFLEQTGTGYRVKLVDFGIAAMLDGDEGTGARQRLGTLRYMAPEQCRSGQVDGRADLYALGVVLYEGLTRRRVTGKTVSSVCNDVPELPNVVLAAERHLPHSLEDLLMSLLEKHPDHRPSTAEEVARGFEACLAEVRGEVFDEHLVYGQNFDGPGRDLRLWYGIGIATVVGILGGLVWGLIA